MNELPENKKRFNFKRYQNAKKSRRMLIRFIIYSIVIGILVYLILDRGVSSDKNKESDNVESFEIEVE